MGYYWAIGLHTGRVAGRWPLGYRASFLRGENLGGGGFKQNQDLLCAFILMMPC